MRLKTKNCVSGASQVAAASVANSSRFSGSSSGSTSLHCTFCGLTGSHVLENCFKFKEAAQEAQNGTKSKKRGKGKANAAKESDNDPKPTESAGAVSTRSPASTSFSNSWNADTGAKHFALGVPGPNRFHLDLPPEVSCHHKYEKNHTIKSVALPKKSVSPILCIAAVNKFHLAISTVPPEL